MRVRKRKLYKRIELTPKCRRKKNNLNKQSNPVFSNLFTLYTFLKHEWTIDEGAETRSSRSAIIPSFIQYIFKVMILLHFIS